MVTTSNYQLQSVVRLLEAGFKIKLEDLLAMTDKELEYLMANFGIQMAQILKNKETADEEKLSDCAECGGEVDNANYRLGKSYFCFSCWHSFG